MLIPRFSIRWVLLLTTLSGLLFIVVAQAVRGQTWALALTGAAVFVGACFLFFGVTFLSAYALARSTRSLKPQAAPHNPFIHDGALPPQVVPQGAFGRSGSDEN